MTCPFYSLPDLAAIWRIPLDDVFMMFSDELAAAGRDVGDSANFHVTWAMAVGVASVFHIYRPVEIERASGDDFGRVRSNRWRTIRIELYVPNFVAEGIAKMELLPAAESLGARAERLLCEQVEAEYLAVAVFREPTK